MAKVKEEPKFNDIDTQIIKRFGKEKFVMASDINDDFAILSTGSLMLDLALGKGIAPGIFEYAGLHGTGKTTLSLEACVNAQKIGYKTYYMAMERAHNASILKSIKDLDLSKLTIAKPGNGEECCDIVESLIRSNTDTTIVVDSVAAMCVSEKTQDESASHDSMAILARMLSKWAPKMAMLAVDRNCRLILINQLRTNIGQYGSPDMVVGGRALPFFCNEKVSLKFSKSKDMIVDENGNRIGQNVHAEVTKTRFSPPFGIVDVPIIYGKGIDKTLEIANAAIHFGIISKETGWFKYGEEKLHGMDTLKQFIVDNNLYDKLKNSIMEMIK